MRSIQNKTTHILTEAAVMIGFSAILSIIKIIQMPFGGAVTLCSMLPIVVFCYRHGGKWGIVASLCYSVTQMLIDAPVIGAAFLPGDDRMVLPKAILMVLLDFVFAYGLVGISGFLPHRLSPSGNIAVCALIGTSCRYLMHTLSGWILWGSYAEWFFSDELSQYQSHLAGYILSHFSGQGLAAVYSILYNGIYMIPEILITVIAGYAIGKVPAISQNRIY